MTRKRKTEPTESVTLESLTLELALNRVSEVLKADALKKSQGGQRGGQQGGRKRGGQKKASKAQRKKLLLTLLNALAERFPVEDSAAQSEQAQPTNEPLPPSEPKVHPRHGEKAEAWEPGKPVRIWKLG